jgi:hypothetical protein
MVKIKAFIKELILKIPTIESKILEKREYNKIYVAEELPAEHDIKNWINFLPPLSKLKMISPQPLSPNFQDGLLEDFKKGNANQFEKTNAIRSKIVFYSLAIQMMIQRVIDGEKLILTNGANEPFVENACCNTDGSIETLKYFIEKESTIKDYNKQVSLLRDVIDDIISIQKSSTYYDPSNTRTKYPDIPENFSEETIYLAFITYCKFNSNIPIPDSIQHLCHNKPSTDIYNPLEESIQKKIARLKETGEYNYTPEALQALLEIVNKEHIIPFNFNPTEISYIQRMRDLIKSCQERQLPEIPETLLKKLEELLDTFDITILEDTNEMREFKNFLAESNQAMVTEILEFITRYKRLDKRKTALYRSFLLNITNFRLIGDGILSSKRDTTAYKGMQFVINEMRNLISVFPNIIMNTVNNQKISIPKYMGLSKQHVKDIQTIVKNYYSSLEKFIKDKDKDNSILANVVKGIMKETKEWFLFAQNTPLFASISLSSLNRPMGAGIIEGEEIDIEELEEEEMIEEGQQEGLLMGFFGKQQESRKSKRTSANAREREEGEARQRSAQPLVKGYYSIFNESLVRRLFTYYFLNVVMKYVNLSKGVEIKVAEERLREEDVSELLSVLEAEDQRNGVVSEVLMVPQENVELKSMVANLLLVFFDIIMSDKVAINVNNKSVKEDITQSKDKEKDIITREFRDMQITEREVENIKKNLRLGDWNVGATKGLRIYVPETYEQEREEMEREFRREEAKAKMENRVRKNDKVTERMKDIFADEEEENRHQAGIIDGDLADDFNLQGDDDDYGMDDDGAYNPRETSERDD